MREKFQDYTDPQRRALVFVSLVAVSFAIFLF